MKLSDAAKKNMMVKYHLRRMLIYRPCMCDKLFWEIHVGYEQIRIVSVDLDLDRRVDSRRNLFLWSSSSCVIIVDLSRGTSLTS